MSVVAKIKGKIKYADLVEENIDYGVHDNTYRLCQGSEDSKIVVFFDTKTIGRGIEVERQTKTIELKLASSSTRDDIRLFYDLIDKICKINKQNKFTIEGEEYSSDEINELKNAELKDVDSTFKTMITFIKHQGGQISIFGARNPIDFDIDLLEHLEYNYDKYEKFICERQQVDAYYCSPIIMTDRAGKHQGVFTINVGRYIVPIEPKVTYADAPKDLEVDNWYVGYINNENKILKYNDFINYNYKNYFRYDANHIAVEITKEELKELFDNFSIDIKSI